MELLNKFWNIIGSPPPPKKLDVYRELAKLRPNKFYVENVRNLLGLSFEQAVGVVNDAVEQGIFVKGVEILCPDGVVAWEGDETSSRPPTVECYEFNEGSYDPAEYSTVELATRTYYRLAQLR